MDKPNNRPVITVFTVVDAFSAGSRQSLGCGTSVTLMNIRVPSCYATLQPVFYTFDGLIALTYIIVICRLKTDAIASGNFTACILQF